METSTHIDWISFTDLSRERWRLPAWLNGLASEEGKGMNGYDRSKKFTDGTLQLRSSSRPEMGVHYIMTGQVVNRLRERGFTDYQTMAYVDARDYRLSRIDLALDMQNTEFDIDVLIDQWQSEACITSIRSKPHYVADVERQVETLYIGSRKTRKKMLRVYRKDVEMKIDDMKWVRIEAELRGQNAQRAKEAIIDNQDIDISIRAIIRGIADFPEYDRWIEAMTAIPQKLPVKAWEKGDTRKWLLTQVAPALAREISYDDTFLRDFMEAVEIAKLRIEQDKN